MLQSSAHPADLVIKKRGSKHATPPPSALSFRLYERLDLDPEGDAGVAI